ncbi:uncharacterized protein At4g02000-like [Eucalyptus grandis]|uniref:uncharacterized protein At4g02000-like n=1 Tax=Eucalyptus grandis TaxID=71139 RepID=UPI00192E7BD2|nr:uncharacterized protein At4g02000-like [Eucalyptus grandis]
MAHVDEEHSPRLAALCKSLGRLCSPHDLEVWNDEPTPAKLNECHLTLIGKVFANSPINFQAFQSIMKNVWRTEQVDISQREDGLYVAKFKLLTDKQRISEGGPWVFSGHLVVFKPWIPNTPLHCYDFSTCTFWVQVFGLPLELCTEQIIRKAVMTVGKVLEVRADGQDTFTMRSGRARVEIDFRHPLQTGRLIRINDKTLWLDFRYERLAHYCYLCGKLGHYTTSCPTKSVNVDVLTREDKLPYGQWLRAELKEHSPYRKLYYETKEVEDTVEEVVPETPPTIAPSLPLLPPIPSSGASPSLQPLVTDIPPASKLDGSSHTALIPALAKQKGVQLNINYVHQDKRLKSSRHISKVGPVKS